MFSFSLLHPSSIPSSWAMFKSALGDFPAKVSFTCTVWSSGYCCLWLCWVLRCCFFRFGSLCCLFWGLARYNCLGLLDWGSPLHPEKGDTALVMWRLLTLKPPATASLFLGCKRLINQNNTRGTGIYREELLYHWCFEVAALLGDGNSSSLLSFLWTG